MDAAADPPLRQLTRLRAELSTATADFTSGLFPEQHVTAIEFGIVAKACLPDWTASGQLARPIAGTRAISIRQIASSLGAPPETVRRHVHLLQQRGALTASPAGMSLAATAENEAFVARYFTGVHDRFVRLIEDVAWTCDLDLPIAAVPAYGFADIVARAIDMLLMSIDTFRPYDDAYSTAYRLWGALTAVSVRNVTYDPVLARLYADTIPPDDVRIGISLRRFAAGMGVPYATAWRNMQMLEDQGLVTRLADGRWAVLTRNLLVDSAYRLNAPASVRLLKKLRELAMLGLDPAHAATLYREGRPPLADLGLSQNG